MQEGTAGPVNGARVGLVQRLDKALASFRVVRVIVQQTHPSTPNTDYFVTFTLAPVGHRLNGRVQARDVPAAG